MLSEEGLDERTRRNDAQAFEPCGLESRLDQSRTDAATSKSWRHLRVDEHQRVPSALAGEDGHLCPGHELEPVRNSVVRDTVIPT